MCNAGRAAGVVDVVALGEVDREVQRELFGGAAGEAVVAVVAGDAFGDPFDAAEEGMAP